MMKRTLLSVSATLLFGAAAGASAAALPPLPDVAGVVRGTAAGGPKGLDLHAVGLLSGLPTLPAGLPALPGLPATLPSLPGLPGVPLSLPVLNVVLSEGVIPIARLPFIPLPLPATLVIVTGAPGTLGADVLALAVAPDSLSALPIPSLSGTFHGAGAGGANGLDLSGGGLLRGLPTLPALPDFPAKLPDLPTSSLPLSSVPLTITTRLIDGIIPSSSLPLTLLPAPLLTQIVEGAAGTAGAELKAHAGTP